LIPDDQVEEVKARADIVDVVGEFVDLKRAGREYKANCPFHEERTPSFYVVPAKSFYHCFGCGKQGDVFTFVQERLGLDFVESVRWVANRAGVELREVKRDQADDDPHRPLYEANAFAAAWFRERLLDERDGARARAYLEARGIGAETAERFQLGYAPDDWRGFSDAAGKHRIPAEILLEAGLLTTSERSSEPYDRFRDRVMFPIESLGGRVVAFGGRILGGGGEGQPKYLNSPESPIYRKGRLLYGLHRARHAVRREERALVVEGYMDVVSLAAAGFENVVAALGTALTEEHARLLRRYTVRVLLLFDSDPAGLRATFKAGDMLLAAGLHPSVVTLPPGEDPDTLVRGQGAEGLRGYLDQAVDVLERKLQILAEHDYFEDPSRIRDAVDRLLPTLRATSDATLRDIYVTRVAQRTGVRRETLEDELRRGLAHGSPAGPPRERGAPSRPPERRGGALRPRLGPEFRLLQVLARDKERRHERLETALMSVGPGDFSDEVARAIFQAFLDEPDLEAPPDEAPAAVRERMTALLAPPADEDELAHAGRTFTESLTALKRAALERQAEDLDRRIELASSQDEKRSLANEKAGVAGELRAMGQGWAHTARKLKMEPRTHTSDGRP
jgi:DNA primase